MHILECRATSRARSSLSVATTLNVTLAITLFTLSFDLVLINVTLANLHEKDCTCSTLFIRACFSNSLRAKPTREFCFLTFNTSHHRNRASRVRGVDEYEIQLPALRADDICLMPRRWQECTFYFFEHLCSENVAFRWNRIGRSSWRRRFSSPRKSTIVKR